VNTIKLGRRSFFLIMPAGVILSVLSLVILAFVVFASTQGGKALWTWKSSTSVTALAYSPNGKLIAVGLDDGRVQMLRAADGTPLWVSQALHPYGVSAVTFSPDGQVLASGGGEGNIRLTSSRNGSLIRGMDAEDVGYGIDALVFNNDGQVLAFGSRDGKVRLWHITDGSQEDMIGLDSGLGPDSQAFILSLILNSDGTTLIAADEYSRISEWRLSDRHLLKSTQSSLGHGSTARAIALSPNQERAATGLYGIPAVSIWHLGDGSAIESEDLVRNAWSLAFSPDGQLLASGEGRCEACSDPDGGNLTIRIWRIDRATEQAKFSGNSASIRALSWSPDGTRLVSGTEDGTVRLWKIK